MILIIRLLLFKSWMILLDFLIDIVLFQEEKLKKM